MNKLWPWLFGAFLLSLACLGSTASAQSVTTPSYNAIVCAYNNSPPTLSSGTFGLVQCGPTGGLSLSNTTTTPFWIDTAPASDLTALLEAPMNCNVSATPPTYSAGPANCSLDLAGNLRINGSGTTQPTTQAPNVTPTDCSGSITTGGTAQAALAAQITLHGFTIANIDNTTGSGEPLWISFTTTAAAATSGSYPLAAPTATTYASLASFTSPPGFATNHAISVIAATTAHKFSCTWW